MSRGICHGKILHYRRTSFAAIIIARLSPWHHHYYCLDLHSWHHHYRRLYIIAPTSVRGIILSPRPPFTASSLLLRLSTRHHYHLYPTPLLHCVSKRVYFLPDKSGEEPIVPDSLCSYTMLIFSARSIPGEELMVPELFSQLHLAIESLNLSSFQNLIILMFIICAGYLTSILFYWSIYSILRIVSPHG